MSGRRALYGWLTATAISLVGSRLSMLALPWFVLTTTGSATKTGLVALAEMAPMVGLKVLGGPIIDRVGPRRVSIVCDLGSAAAVGAIPLLHAADLLAFPLFLAVVAVSGAFMGPGDAAKNAMIPMLVEQARVPTERATGLSSMIERGAGMFGAAIGGGLIALWGAPTALLVDAGSFLFCAALLAWATAGLGRVGGADDDTAPYGQRLAQGWRFLRGDRVLVGIAVMVTLTNLIDIAMSAVLMPVWAHESGAGIGSLGLVFAVMAGFSAAGSGVAAAYAARLPRYSTYLVAFLVCGAPRFLVLAVEAPLAVVLAVFAVAGFASGFLNPVLGAVELERIPAHLVGRVTSLMTAACFALMPFGGLLGGGLVAWLGLSAALVVCGAGYFVVTMFPAVDPTWKEIDRRPSTDAADLPAGSHPGGTQSAP